MTKNIKVFVPYCLFFLLSFSQASAQRRGATRTKATNTTNVKIDSAKWRVENYIVNRDSAFANPYYALQKLVGGNKRFQQSRSIYPRQDPALIERLSKGQSPFATIIGCSDSRVSSEILFDQGFGDLFIARTAGQVMAEATYATIEYAYLELGTKLVVVLGHSSCGAVSAAIKRPENPPGHIVTLINAIKPAALEIKNMPGDSLDNAVRRNVINQVKLLRGLESVLSRAYSNGDLLIVGAVYNLSSGKMEVLKETLEDLPKTRYNTADITGKY
ncbi:carbonic anhydrase [Segetibacter sp.]|jgi:carbonic anhydrase|uniref:carbonic anhydrase n=1 Tax=Segetibacter sp. TaxID=2231182 RepID=UPI002604694E|nr:carbonic anhydrase [Segetibacter sp.]MCW3080561.1 Carbonic anhydrase [Segetibacter sp.]